jgi:hypothetical protein
MIDTNKIMNPQALTNIFGIMPDFIGSELMDIRIKSFKRTLVIQLMTNQPVQNKPQRWEKWDVIYIEISLFDIRNLIINGDISTNSIIQFNLEQSEKDGLLDIKCNNQMNIKCSFDWARVEQITPGLIGCP